MNKTYSFQQLKTLITLAKNLAEPLNYFFDMAEKEMLKGNFLTELNEPLQAVLKLATQSVAKILNKPATVIKSILTEIPEQHLVHGMVFFATGISPFTIIYFTDIRVGIGVVSGTSGNTEMFRFALSTQKEMAKRQYYKE